MAQKRVFRHILLTFQSSARSLPRAGLANLGRRPPRRRPTAKCRGTRFYKGRLPPPSPTTETTEPRVRGTRKAKANPLASPRHTPLAQLPRHPLFPNPDIVHYFWPSHPALPSRKCRGARFRLSKRLFAETSPLAAALGPAAARCWQPRRKIVVTVRCACSCACCFSGGVKS